MCMHDGDLCAAWVLQSKSKGLYARLCAQLTPIQARLSFATGNDKCII